MLIVFVITVVDNTRRGALCCGLAVTAYNSTNWLFAANFSQDRIEVYNSRWQRILWVWNGRRFVRPFAKPADISRSYVPFNIQYLEGLLYVAYAELIQPANPAYDPADPYVERTCPGCGFVAVYDLRGLHISALDHARRFGQKIVALGGVPTVEVGATMRQSLHVEEMLRQDLELERQAMRAYLAAHSLAEDDVALRNMLEDQIEQEQRDIEELELYLDMVRTGAVVPEVNLRVV